jgi:hypothetical protein
VKNPFTVESNEGILLRQLADQDDNHLNLTPKIENKKTRRKWRV